ncbi:MAG: alpha/beta fold hydrolase [Pseudomonadota bacterium]
MFNSFFRQRLGAALASCVLLGFSAGALAQPIITATTYDLSPGVQATVFSPSTSPWGVQRPAILMIPGGGFLSSDPTGLLPLAQYYAQQGFVTVATTYRVAPPYPRPADFNAADPKYGVWPAQINDVRKVVWTLREFAPQLQIDPNRIAALGVSAGGMLAAHLGLSDVRDPTNTYSSKVQRIISISGPWDPANVVERFRLAAINPWIWPNPYAADPNSLGIVMTLFGGTPQTLADNLAPTRLEEDIRPASPRTYVSNASTSVAATMAPTLLLHGANDQLVPPYTAQAVTPCQEINNKVAGKCQIYVAPGLGHELPQPGTQAMNNYLNYMNTFLTNWMAQ